MPDPTTHFAQGLDAALGPAELLPFESGQLRRDFGGRFDFAQKIGLPTGQLGAIAQVQVFTEGVGVPAAHRRVINTGAPPDAAGAIEADGKTTRLPARLFDHKMTIQRQRLTAGQG